MEKRRQPEIFAGRVNADGSIAASAPVDAFTVTKTATGTYVVTLTGGRLVALVPAIAQAGAFTVHADTYGERSVNVVTFTVGTTPTNTDAAFSFMAAGVQQ